MRLTSLSIRRFKIFGLFPVVRLIQIIENPKYIIHILKKNIYYKNDKRDYSIYYEKINFLSANETLIYLIEKNISLARFGDGEFDQLFGAGEYPPDSDWSQKWSKSLENDLKNLLENQSKKLLLAFYPPSVFLASKNSKPQKVFSYNMWIDMKRMLWKYLKPEMVYGHAQLFIHQVIADFDWDLFKKHVSNKEIIIVTGNTKSIEHLKLGKQTYFIEAGNTDAYERKGQIISKIKALFTNNNISKKSALIFLSLGPTACLIANELKDEFVCWDTGHIFEFAASNFFETLINKSE